MTAIYILVEFAMLWVSARRLGVLPAPTAFYGYIVIGHLVLVGANLDWIYYPFLLTWTTFAYQQFSEQVHLSLFVIFLLTFISCAGLRAEKEAGPIALIPASIGVERLAYLILLLLWFRTLTVLPFLRWDYVMSNSNYLLLGGPGALTSPGGLPGLMHSAGKIAGLVCAVLFGFAVAQRRTVLMVLTLPLIGWHFLYELAGYSRYAFVYATVIAIVVFFSTQGPRRLWGTLFAAMVALLSLIVALDGRGEGQYGLATLPQMLDFDNLVATLRVSIGNLFEGIFVFAEHFRAEIEYEESYKFLSLSVLPSVLDGFSGIQASGERRLHFYVPRGAIDEVLQFGMGYAAAYALACMAAVRASVRLLISRRRPIIAMVLNIVLLLAMQLQFTYSTRTVFRIFVGVWLLSVTLHILGRTRGGALAARVRVPAPRSGGQAA